MADRASLADTPMEQLAEHLYAVREGLVGLSELFDALANGHGNMHAVGPEGMGELLRVFAFRLSVAGELLGTFE